MQPPEPVHVLELFAEDRATLVALLDELTDEEWRRPTVCAGWTVHDVALHLLGGDLGNLSRRRDRFSGLKAAPGESVVEIVNRINDEWLRAARRLSPRVTVDLLRIVGKPMFAYFSSLNLNALGEPVSWAGPGPAPVWLDVAREYTERWHHQQHIRNAIGKPGQTERRYMNPILATFAHALPVSFQSVSAPANTVVQLHVEGEAGGDWAVARDNNRWRLYQGAPDAPNAKLTLDASTAWRLFTKGISPEAARAVARVEGNVALAEPILNSVAIIA